MSLGALQTVSLFAEVFMPTTKRGAAERDTRSRHIAIICVFVARGQYVSPLRGRGSQNLVTSGLTYIRTAKSLLDK